MYSLWSNEPEWINEWELHIQDLKITFGLRRTSVQKTPRGSGIWGHIFDVTQDQERIWIHNASRISVVWTPHESCMLHKTDRDDALQIRSLHKPTLLTNSNFKCSTVAVSHNHIHLITYNNKDKTIKAQQYFRALKPTLYAESHGLLFLGRTSGTIQKLATSGECTWVSTEAS